MAKKDSQKKFKSFLKHITKYLDDEGIEHNVTVKREPDDPDDMNKVTKSVSIVFYKNTQPLANLHCYCTIFFTLDKIHRVNILEGLHYSYREITVKI